MKKIATLLALLLCVGTSFGQAVLAPNTVPVPYTQYGQMLNLSNTHANAANDSSTGTLYTTTASWLTSTGLPVIFPIAGNGLITFTHSCLHASTTSTVNPVVTSTLQSSSDNVRWGAVAGVSVLTVTPTSATVPTVTKVTVTTNTDLYYRWKNVITLDTASVITTYFLNKSTQIRN